MRHGVPPPVQEGSGVGLECRELRSGAQDGVQCSAGVVLVQDPCLGIGLRTQDLDVLQRLVFPVD